MFKRHYTTVAFGISFLFLIVGFSLYYVKLAHVESLIIIHFLAGRGADFLGDRGDALAMLLSGIAMALINYCLALTLLHRNRLLAHLISILTILLALLILIAIIVIINVN